MNRISVISLIVANLIVAIVVTSEQWGYYSVLLVYWCEAMIVGLYSLGRMCVTCWFGDPFGKRVGMANGPSRLVLSMVLGAFFILKFGGFALGMGLCVSSIPSLLADGGSSGGFMEIMVGLEAVGVGVGVAAAILFVSHGVSFVLNFVGRAEYKRSNVLMLLFKPYLRMALVLVVLAVGFAGAVASPDLSRTTGFAVGVVLIKLLVDAASHVLEHRRRAALEASTAS